MPSMDPNTCERCGEPNAWKLIDKDYEHLCGACANRKSTIYTEGAYRYVMHCRAQDCDQVGPVNYRGDDGEPRFYCGGGPGHTP